MPNIDVKHPGVLKVPEGKNVEDLPQSHFENLVKDIGYEKVIRALTNLEVWNKNKNKSLSFWASNMADKLKKKFKGESIMQVKEERVFNTIVAKDIEEAIKALKTRLEPNYINFKQSKEPNDKNAIFAFSRNYSMPYKVARFNPDKKTLDILVESSQKSVKQLVEAANRKCEMRWKVLVFDSEKDNELVDEFKDFECIDCAAMKKREILEKHPNRVVEIIAESVKTQKSSMSGINKITRAIESTQKNETINENELKAWLKKEHSRALNLAYGKSNKENQFFYRGYASAIHEMQRKLGL